jgi:hypothetical protein
MRTRTGCRRLSPWPSPITTSFVATIPYPDDATASIDRPSNMHLFDLPVPVTDCLPDQHALVKIADHGAAIVV